MSYKVFEKVEKFSKVGNRWHLDNADEYRVIPEEYVSNNVEASGWFRRLGGYERTERAYTIAGYKPIRQISISSDRTQKRVYTWVWKPEEKINPEKY